MDPCVNNTNDTGKIDHAAHSEYSESIGKFPINLHARHFACKSVGFFHSYTDAPRYSKDAPSSGVRSDYTKTENAVKVLFIVGHTSRLIAVPWTAADLPEMNPYPNDTRTRRNRSLSAAVGTQNLGALPV